MSQNGYFPCTRTVIKEPRQSIHCPCAP